MASADDEKSAALRVVLYADQVVVRQSSDPKLWQDVLAAINGRASLKTSASNEAGGEGEELEGKGSESKLSNTKSGPSIGSSPLEKFAVEIGVSAEEIEGACAPQGTEPFLILDHDAWESFKTQLGERGPLSVAPAAAAATLLALWFKYSGVQTNATVSQAQAVLKTISLRDANAARGIKHSEWLQPRSGGQIVLNPAKITRAKLFARCFCSQNWDGWKAK